MTHCTRDHPDLADPVVEPVTRVARASLEVKSTGMAECAVLMIGFLRLERLAIRACNASKGLLYLVGFAFDRFVQDDARVGGAFA